MLLFYLKSYRQEFGKEMEYVFAESLKDARAEQGNYGIVSLWARTIVDTVKNSFLQQLDNRKGSVTMKARNNDVIMQNKVFAWIALATTLVLTIPYLAMQYEWVKPDPNNPADQGVNWTLSDFVIMGILIFGIASLFVLAARRVTRKNRLLTGLAFAFVFLWILAELAVGVFTNIGS